MWTVPRVVPGSQPWTKCSTGPRSRVRSERRDTEPGDVPPLGWQRGAAMTLVMRHGVGSSIIPNGRPLAPESGTLIFFPPHPLNLLCYSARATVPKIPNPKSPRQGDLGNRNPFITLPGSGSPRPRYHCFCSSGARLRGFQAATSRCVLTGRRQGEREAFDTSSHGLTPSRWGLRLPRMHLCGSNAGHGITSGDITGVPISRVGVGREDVAPVPRVPRAVKFYGSEYQFNN